MLNIVMQISQVSRDQHTFCVVPGPVADPLRGEKRTLREWLTMSTDARHNTFAAATQGPAEPVRAR